MQRRDLVVVLASAGLHAVVAAAASARELWPLRGVAGPARMNGAVAMMVPEARPAPAEERPAPSQEPEPGPSVSRIEWLGVISKHRCSPFTYGGEEGRELPNTCASRPTGTQCLLTAVSKPTDDGEVCDVMLRCGDEVLYKTGSANCRLRERAKPGVSGPIWDLFIERDRGGSCNGGRSIRVDTSAGRIVWGIDNSYGGPEIEVEGVDVALTAKGVDSEAADEPW